jgi:hypothetical protein
MSVRVEDPNGFLNMIASIDKLPSLGLYFAGKNGKGDDYTDVVNILNEGTATIPARPILDVIAKTLRNRLRPARIAKRLQKKSIEDASAKIAKDIQDTVEKEIMFHIIANRSGGYAMNAESTVRKKGFNHPFVDTGKLAKAVRVKVV